MLHGTKKEIIQGLRNAVACRGGYEGVHFKVNSITRGLGVQISRGEMLHRDRGLTLEWPLILCTKSYLAVSLRPTVTRPPPHRPHTSVCRARACSVAVPPSPSYHPGAHGEPSSPLQRYTTEIQISSFYRVAVQRSIGTQILWCYVIVISRLIVATVSETDFISFALHRSSIDATSS